MKNLLSVLIALMTTVTCIAIAQGPATPLSEDDIKDVIELLKFVKSAKPELFGQFSGSFEIVGKSCERNEYNDEQAQNISEVVTLIEEELPATNNTLLGKIKIATFLGGKEVYSPTFIDRDNVRANVFKYMETVRDTYLAKDFPECARLVSIGINSLEETALAQR